MSVEEAKDKTGRYELSGENFRYLIHQTPLSSVKADTVPETYYFFPIQQSSIDRNSKLKQNNNWGGSFNLAFRIIYLSLLKHDADNTEKHFTLYNYKNDNKQTNISQSARRNWPIYHCSASRVRREQSHPPQ
ncbi:hypothetical protein HMPREF9012_1079 [Bacteroidetes bacterium oral taxon 272 str. F0290]|nr:hypothetical protein HMPREF9012_1079 [Bacteroidetes bacterium oral taxon 272 str. F0290]